MAEIIVVVKELLVTQVFYSNINDFKKQHAIESS